MLANPTKMPYCILVPLGKFQPFSSSETLYITYITRRGSIFSTPTQNKKMDPPPLPFLKIIIIK